MFSTLFKALDQQIVYIIDICSTSQWTFVNHRHLACQRVWNIADNMEGVFSRMLGPKSGFLRSFLIEHRQISLDLLKMLQKKYGFIFQ